jgi:GMP synthase (glutamine-hydrolysing)
MTIHWLQHVPFEGLGCIEPWLNENARDISCTRLWAGDGFPDIGKTDGLIVMGGPMGIYDYEEYPWLAEEKAFIRQIINQNKPVLGICLGAQLIADVLGSNVWKNEHKEIGFFPVTGNPEHEISNVWKTETVFHWHGDTFGIPEGAVRLASSEATENQAFVYKDHVLALQFHLETTAESLLALYENAQDEITDGPFIQTLEEMRPFFPMLGNANRRMFTLLKKLF